MIEFFVIPIFALVVWRSRAFDLPSVALSSAYGLVIWHLRGFAWFFALLLFLVIGLFATKLGTGDQKKKKHEMRTADNVMSNGFVPFMSAVLFWPYFYLGSISAALADTLGSEIGKLSSEEPVLITNPKVKVKAGMNGGVTRAGTFAGIVGSSVIAIFAVLFAEFFAGAAQVNSIKLFFAIVLGGFFGSVADSILGMYFENKKVMTNGSVNFSATLTGGIVTTLIVMLI